MAGWPVEEGIGPVQAVVAVVDGESVGPAQLVGTDLGDVGAVHEGACNVGALTGIAQPVRVKYLAGMDTWKNDHRCLNIDRIVYILESSLPPMVIH